MVNMLAIRVLVPLDVDRLFKLVLETGKRRLGIRANCFSLFFIFFSSLLFFIFFNLKVCIEVEHGIVFFFSIFAFSCCPFSLLIFFLSLGSLSYFPVLILCLVSLP